MKLFKRKEWKKPDEAALAATKTFPIGGQVEEARRVLDAAVAATQANQEERARLAEESQSLWGKMGDPATGDREALEAGTRRQVCEARVGRLDGEHPALESAAQEAQRELELAERAQAQEQVDGLVAQKAQLNEAAAGKLEELLEVLEQGQAVLGEADKLAEVYNLATPPRARFLVKRSTRLRAGADELRRMLALDFVVE